MPTSAALARRATAPTAHTSSQQATSAPLTTATKSTTGSQAVAGPSDIRPRTPSAKKAALIDAKVKAAAKLTEIKKKKATPADQSQGALASSSKGKGKAKEQEPLHKDHARLVKQLQGESLLHCPYLGTCSYFGTVVQMQAQQAAYATLQASFNQLSEQHAAAAATTANATTPAVEMIPRPRAPFKLQEEMGLAEDRVMFKDIQVSASPCHALNSLLTLYASP